MLSPKSTAPTYEDLRAAVKKLKKADDLISLDLRESLARCHWSQEDRQKLVLQEKFPGEFF